MAHEPDSLTADPGDTGSTATAVGTGTQIAGGAPDDPPSGPAVSQPVSPPAPPPAPPRGSAPAEPGPHDPNAGVHRLPDLAGDPLAGGGSATKDGPPPPGGPAPQQLFRSDFPNKSGYATLPWAENLRDPTRALQEENRTLLSFPEGVVERWAARLAGGEPLLLLSCPDRSVAYSAVHTLRRLMPEFPARELTFGGFALTDQAIEMRMFGHEKFGGGGYALICVFADTTDGDTFLGTLPDAPHYYDLWKSTLREERRVVVITTPERPRAKHIAKSRELRYVEPVDFIAPLIRERFPNDWVAMAEGVTRQHARGLWGESDEKLLQWLYTPDPETFAAEYAVRQRAMEEADAIAAVTRHRHQQLASDRVTLDDSTPIDAAVLFTAAYFPRLRVAEFLQVVTALLGDERTHGSSEAASHDGRDRSLRLDDLWKRGMRGYLKACGIRTHPTPPAKMDFSTPDVRDAVQTQFESFDIVFHEQLCARVEAAGLIAHVSPDVRSSAIALIARRMIADKQGYGATCLPALIGPLRPSIPSATTGGEATSKPRVMDPLAFAHIPAADAQRIVTALHALFTRLLDESALDLVVQLVKTMMDHHRHEELLWLLPRMSHAAFADDRFQFYRRLLDEGNEETRKGAQQTLLRTLSAGGLRAAAVLRVLRTWADGSDAPHAARATVMLRDLITGTMAANRAPRPHPMASALASVTVDEAETMLAWVAEQTSGDLLQELEGIPNGKLLCLSYLWMLPRPLPARAFDATSGLWPFIQIAWFASLGDGVRTLLGEAHDEPLADMFAALALADCGVALSAPDADVDEPTRDARLASIAGAVAALPARRQRAVRAHWRVMEQALGACLMVLPETSAAADAPLRHQLRDRWRGMRLLLKTLLAGTASHDQERVKP